MFKKFNSQTNTPSSLLSWLPHITRYENPAFFTILGPEGVGKTTLCNNLIKIFRKFPIRFRQFHHTAEWKGGYHADEAMTLTSKLKQQKEASLEVNRAPAKMPSFLRKCLPKNALHNLSAFRAELIYMDRVSKYLKAGHKAKDLVISDRYCYDRLVRWQNLNKAPGQRLGARLVCRLMRRPIAAFVLRDSAENIHSRKQVMSMQEIELHQEMLVRTCTKLRVPFEELWVTKKTAECVASLVTKRILELAGHRMFEVVNFDPQ